MNVLVIGAGGREHAIAWKLKQSKKVERVFCAPGNGGMSLVAKCVNIKPENTKTLIDFVQRNKIDLTVVGPEGPLASGIVDEFQKRKLRIFGPERKAAQLESSKVFAKTFMQKYHIPTAPFRVFTTFAEAIGFCKSVEFPVVIKADGLAAGKGVVVVKDMNEATQVIMNIMEKKVFGNAGAKLIVESCLKGQEVSVMAITDGKAIMPLVSSQDHKQAYDGDRGPNTGGMGAFAPTPYLSDDLNEQIMDHVLQPTIAGLRNEGITFRGILYAGLMLTEAGPKVLEFNCRFGDPETQVVLPLLKTDFAELLMLVADKKLNNLGKLEWRQGSAVAVVMASRGYPGKYSTGQRIQGLPLQFDNNSYVFHSGTRRDGNQFFTNGGRVLSVLGMDTDLKSAQERAYSLVRKIRFDGAVYRKDIGFRVFQNNGSK